jgi:hypothetical protein
MDAHSSERLRQEAHHAVVGAESPSETRQQSRRNPPKSDGPTTRGSPHEDAARKVNGRAVQPLLLPWVDQGVYFVERDGLIKIGETGSLRKRLAALRQGKRKVQLLAIGAADGLHYNTRQGAERRVHHLFRHLHVGFEWFTPDAALLEFIEDVAQTGLIPQHLCIPIYMEPHVPRLSNGPRSKRKLHYMRRACLRRAQLVLTVAALIEARRAQRGAP